MWSSSDSTDWGSNLVFPLTKSDLYTMDNSDRILRRCSSADYSVTDASSTEYSAAQAYVKQINGASTDLETINLDSHVTVTCQGADCVDCPLLIDWAFLIEDNALAGRNIVDTD